MPEYAYLTLMGIIRPKDQDEMLHSDHADKLVRDLLALLDVYGLRLAGNVEATSYPKIPGRNSLDIVKEEIYRSSVGIAADAPDDPTTQDSGLRCMRCGGETPTDSCVAEQEPTTDAADVVDGTPPEPWNRPSWQEHKHQHEHLDYLQPEVVKITHTHWHVHSRERIEEWSTRQGVYHSGLHTDWGRGDEPGTPSNHAKSYPVEFIGFADSIRSPLQHTGPKVSIATNDGQPMPVVVDESAIVCVPGGTCDPLTGLADGDDSYDEGCCGAAGRDPGCCEPDGYFITLDTVSREHLTTCIVCQNCESCREGVRHSHIGSIPSHTSVRSPLNEYELINSERG